MSFAGRGLISGLRRGMYKETNFVIDPKCLDQATQNYFINAFTTFGTPSFKWEEQILGIATGLNSIADNCLFDETLNDYLTYCYQVEMCEPQIMIQTLLKKVFQVTTVANDFAQMVGEGIPQENAKAALIEEFYDRLGSNVGKLVRYGTEFDPTLIHLLF